MLTIALVGGDGGQDGPEPGRHHVLVARSDDPLVVKEVHVTAYHVLWSWCTCCSSSRACSTRR